jgi:hypothetical protein
MSNKLFAYSNKCLGDADKVVQAIEGLNKPGREALRKVYEWYTNQPGPKPLVESFSSGLRSIFTTFDKARKQAGVDSLEDTGGYWYEQRYIDGVETVRERVRAGRSFTAGREGVITRHMAHKLEEIGLVAYSHDNDVYYLPPLVRRVLEGLVPGVERPFGDMPTRHEKQLPDVYLRAEKRRADAAEAAAQAEKWNEFLRMCAESEPIRALILENGYSDNDEGVEQFAHDVNASMLNVVWLQDMRQKINAKFNERGLEVPAYKVLISRHFGRYIAPLTDERFWYREDTLVSFRLEGYDAANPHWGEVSAKTINMRNEDGTYTRYVKAFETDTNVSRQQTLESFENALLGLLLANFVTEVVAEMVRLPVRLEAGVEAGQGQWKGPNKSGTS